MSKVRAAFDRPLAAHSHRRHDRRLPASSDEVACVLAHSLSNCADLRRSCIASWNGAPIKHPERRAEVTSLTVEIAPGGETNWHEHPVPSFGVLLEGTLEVSLADDKQPLSVPRPDARPKTN